MTSSAIRRLQTDLAALGHSPGPIDGLWGLKTKAAVRAFQRAAGLVPDGNPGPLTMAAIGSRMAGVSLPLNVLDYDMLPSAPLRGVIGHWTAGTHSANRTDREHYHVLVEGDGNIIYGNHSIADNVPPLKSGRYAAHTLNCNSNYASVSLCGMKGAIERPFDPGKYPVTKDQWKVFIQSLADICYRYKLEVSRKTCLTHAEVEKELGIRQRQKWDITRLTFMTVEGATEIGDVMRTSVLENIRAR